MISKQMSMAELMAEFGCDGKEVRQRIKTLKNQGALIELRPYSQPHIDKKRKRVFCFIAKTQDMFAA